MAKAAAARKSVEGPAPKRQPLETKFPDLDRLIHEKTRLAIVSALAVNPSVTFNEMKAILKTTDGNVSVHTRKLEEAGYLSCKKSFEGRMPKTEYSLTAAGRRALEKYLQHMEALIKATRGE
ncbi:MAG TPA: transcriptional regulator [Thermoanaerobaculia bacterium]|nr:transcriptional regulator [Thermoanaerobaculia bacterium]